MSYKKSTYEVEKWHQAAIKRASRDLPFTNEDQKFALHHHDYAYTRFLERYEAMPKSEKFVYLKEDTFKERLERCATQEAAIITETGIGTGSYHILKYAEFWKDMLSMSAYYNRLATERAVRLLKIYLRCAKTREVFGMALAGRSLLELGISHASAQKVMVKALGGVFDRLQEYDDPLSVILTVEDLSSVEHALVQGIWGTRLYTGTLGDGNKKKGKEDTSIWGNLETPDDDIAAKNIMTDIKGRAKRMEHGDGVFDYRMYEYLCDVVHPSALGYGLLIDEAVDDHGEVKVTLTKGKSEPRLADQIVAAATWGACHGIGLISEAAEEFEKIEPTLSSWADGHIKREKYILSDFVEKKVH